MRLAALIALVLLAGCGASAGAAQAIPDTYLPVVRSLPSVPTLVSIPNGDFEQGAAGWLRATRYITTTMADGVTPFDGVAVAALPEQAEPGAPDGPTLTRALVVPPEAPYLTYQLWVVSEEADCTLDGAVVVAYQGPLTLAVDALRLCGAEATTGWVRGSLDLSAVAGQEVYVEVTAVTAGGPRNSTLYVDSLVFAADP